QEGSSIKEGDPIVEIYDNDPDFLKRLQTEREAILRKIQANRLGVETSFINVGRQKKLFEEGLSSRKNYEQANLEYTKYLAEEAKSSAELTSIDTKLARQSRQKILAPRDGIITKRMAGSVAPLVKSGERLATLVPETTSRIVELYVDGNDIPLIREGDKVRLQFEGWPSFQFSGWPNLSVGTFSAQVFFIDPIDNGEGKFRILITPEDEKLWPSYSILRQGVRVNGWIILNRVSLAYEIWRQLNGFPPLPSKKNNIAEKK
nr:HlyD family efflux transporter periplasmic adaptor subunit [Bacteriovoracaceae bacterium]